MMPPLTLSWQTTRLHYRVVRGGRVGAHKSQAWRGMLGHALRNHDLGLYYQLFEHRVSPLHPLGRRFRQGPVPYVLRVPEQTRLHVEAGEVVVVYLTLVGQAAALLPRLLPLCDRLGAAWGPEQVRCTWEGYLVQPPATWAQLAALPVAPALRLWFDTPWTTPAAPTWPGLVAGLAERQSLLDHFFCAAAWREDTAGWEALAAQTEVEQAALHAASIARYSSRQGRKMELDGWAGTWHLTALPPALAPLLMAGRVLGLGKGAAWGMGSYDLCWIP